MARIDGTSDGAELDDMEYWSASFGTTRSNAQARTGDYSYLLNDSDNYAQRTFTAAFDIFTRACLYITYSATPSEIIAFRFMSAAATQAEVIINPNTGRFLLYLNTGLFRTLVAQSSPLWEFETWQRLEARYLPHDTTGVFELKLEGSVIATFTGDTITDPLHTDVDGFRFAGTAGVLLYVDDLAMDATAYPGDGHIEYGPSDRNGDTNNWTPSAGTNYQNVDEIPPDGDTTCNYSNNPTDLDLYGTTAIDLTGKTVNRVWVDTRLRDTVGGNTIRLAAKTHSTVYYGSSTALTTSYDRYTLEYALNPNTGAAWTEAEINALQVGAEVG